MRWAAEPLASRRKKTEKKNIKNTTERKSKTKIEREGLGCGDRLGLGLGEGLGILGIGFRHWDGLGFRLGDRLGLRLLLGDANGDGLGDRLGHWLGLGLGDGLGLGGELGLGLGNGLGRGVGSAMGSAAMGSETAETGLGLDLSLCSEIDLGLAKTGTVTSSQRLKTALPLAMPIVVESKNPNTVKRRKKKTARRDDEAMPGENGDIAEAPLPPAGNGERLRKTNRIVFFCLCFFFFQ